VPKTSGVSNGDSREVLQRRLATALAHHRRGDLASAERLYAGILDDHPRCFDALHLLGIAKADRGATDAAIGLLRRALAVDPFQANAYCSLARALLAKPDPAAALECLDRALAQQPASADAWYLRGNVLQQTDRSEESVASYESALRLQPVFPEGWNNLAAVLRRLRHSTRALQCVERALAQKPAYAFALNNRGLILLDSGRATAAVESFRQAVAINPQFAEALHNLATALSLLRRFGEAAEVLAKLIEVAPQFPHARGNLLYARLCCCDWTHHHDAVTAVTQAVARGEPAAVPMSILAVSDSAELQLRCAEAYARTHFPERRAPTGSAGRREGRIRLAYLSGDFGEHAVSHQLVRVLEMHDTTRFETFAISWGRQQEGAIRRRLAAAFSRFEDVTDASDDDMVGKMHELGVDIAVDLTGPTYGHRTAILARRAARVQVSFLGYAGTSGAEYMDYLIADEVVIPAGEERWYTERVVRLPHCYLPNDDRRSIAAVPTRTQAGLPEQGLVFCAFTNAYKINPGIFDVWMRLLNGVPGSVLWLRAMGDEARENLLREAAGRGIAGERLVFAPHVAGMAEHLARQSLADLYLDTLPYSAHSTACDALWSGVPVVSCAGGSFAGRVAGSALRAVGMGNLVNESLEGYERKALELARCPQALRRLRERLEEQRGSAPLFDTARFTRDLEAAYQVMHERALRGEPPVGFSVRPAEDRLLDAAGGGLMR
jgi:predicted O-linked N-acetylglucosamine transferase (SPINDLY family)